MFIIFLKIGWGLTTSCRKSKIQTVQLFATQPKIQTVQLFATQPKIECKPN